MYSKVHQFTLKDWSIFGENMHLKSDCPFKALFHLKSSTLTFHKKCFISFNESPLKMMKNAYLILQALFVLKIQIFFDKNIFWSFQKELD